MLHIQDHIFLVVSEIFFEFQNKGGRAGPDEALGVSAGLRQGLCVD